MSEIFVLVDEDDHDGLLRTPIVRVLGTALTTLEEAQRCTRETGHLWIRVEVRDRYEEAGMRRTRFGEGEEGRLARQEEERREQERHEQRRREDEERLQHEAELQAQHPPVVPPSPQYQYVCGRCRQAPCICPPGDRA